MKHIIFDCDGTLINTTKRPFELFPGIRELIQHLSPTCMLYVWTARDRVSTQRILEENGILNKFEALYTVTDGPAKPHTEGLKRLVGKAAKNSICVIGDSVTDIVGGKGFNVLTLGATWNSEVIGSNLKGVGADFLVSHPSDCSKLIELNLKGESDV